MKVYLLTSTHREHGGNVVEGIYSDYNLACQRIEELKKDDDYWRIHFITEWELDTHYIRDDY